VHCSGFIPVKAKILSANDFGIKILGVEHQK
jgi:hypothetical protein